MFCRLYNQSPQWPTGLFTQSHRIPPAMASTQCLETHVTDHCHFTVDLLAYEQFRWNNLGLSSWHRWTSFRKATPMVQDWQVSVRMVTLLGFTDNFIFKLVLKSLHHRQLFCKRPNGIGCFQRWCLQYDKSRHTLYISLHWSLDPWTENRGPQRTRQLCRSDPRNVPSAPTSSTMMRQDYVWERRVQ